MKEKILLHPIKQFSLFLLVIVMIFSFAPITATPAQAATQKKHIKNTNIELAYSSAEYTGKKLSPVVKVKDGKKKLKKNKDYSVKYKKNKKIGKATVVIKGKGRYKGTVKKTFEIRPKKTALTSVKASTNSVILKWKKKAKQLSGYEIQYSTDRKFKRKVKSELLPDITIGQREISGLKANRTYYVRIRTFKEVKGTNYYSSWSKVRSASTDTAYGKSVSKMAVSNADIACRILKDRVKKDGVNNYLFSPFSLYEDLSMAANASGTDTLKELESYLGGNIKTLNKRIKNYNSNLPESVQVANSIWVNELFGTLNKDFQKKTESLYDAKIETVPYNDETVGLINKWVNDHTKGMIPTLLSQLSEDEVMHLINAVAFEAKWKEEYESEDIRNDQFTNKDGKSEDCVMLHSRETEYMDLTNAKGKTYAYGFLKPYNDGKTAFLGLLPADGCSVEDVLKKLNGKSYASMFSKKRAYVNGKLYAGIPEYSLDDMIDLKPYLQNAGVKIAFTDNADFNNMLANGTGLHIDSVLQKTHIEVDRNGTKAAAVTDISMKANSAFMVRRDLHLILNQPFVYAIVDYETGLPYFMGIESSMK